MQHDVCSSNYNGIILKGVGSFYTVLTEGGKEFVCKARGRFRKEGITPVVGDYVEFSLDEKTNSGFIVDIHERKNVLVRPAVANLDKLIIVVSATVPKPDLLLVDKLLITCEMYGIIPVIAINKCDLNVNAMQIALIKKEYAACGYDIFCVSAKSGDGIEALQANMKGYVSCFAGQSAVGKSSILNALMPKLKLETGGLSQKTERGKHTTRHAELWVTPSGGAVLDTPGFSLLEFMSIEPHMLAKLYPEMKEASDNCRFFGCAHINEPDCAVKELLKNGKLSKERYERYVSIFGELDQAYKHRYD